jgi:hypothetical protein
MALAAVRAAVRAALLLGWLRRAWCTEGHIQVAKKLSVGVGVGGEWGVSRSSAASNTICKCSGSHYNMGCIVMRDRLACMRSFTHTELLPGKWCAVQ